MIPKEITAFYNRYKTRLYNTSLRITGDSFDAEEIVQDTIIKYLRTNTAKLTEAQTSAWLTKACTRASIDMLRMRRLLQSQSPQEMIGRIKRQMLLMPDGYRAVLSLLLFEGYDYSETAQILGVEESTVRSQYLRGKRKLVEMIKNEK